MKLLLFQRRHQNYRAFQLPEERGQYLTPPKKKKKENVTRPWVMDAEETWHASLILLAIKVWWKSSLKGNIRAQHLVCDISVCCKLYFPYNSLTVFHKLGRRFIPWDGGYLSPHNT